MSDERPARINDLFATAEPWPGAQVVWSDPPWRLRGRVLTAWIDAPWVLLEALLAPPLWPALATTARVRLRFYDLQFESLGPARGTPPSPRTGIFKEVSVVVPASCAGRNGEFSSLLWTDSHVYMAWAREAFGWSIVPGNIELSGGLWTEPDPSGCMGQARLNEPYGTLTFCDLRAAELREAEAPPAAKPNWFIPRRLVRAGFEGEAREMMVLHPVVESMGMHATVQGRVHCAFEQAHPLGLLSELDAQLELHDAVSLVIGADAAILDEAEMHRRSKSTK